jgi:hypothetical protein
MRPGRSRGATAAAITAWILTLLLSPAILIIGEPLRRLVMRRLRRATTRGLTSSPLSILTVSSQTQMTSYLGGRRPLAVFTRVFMFNPVSIALTAPGRWVGGRLAALGRLARRGVTRGGPRRGPGPPGAGVREPRRPNPVPPADAVELPEPR